MTQWTDSPFLLARTEQGEVILYAESSIWYGFRFGNLAKTLTADEFNRLHDSVVACNTEAVAEKPIPFGGSKAGVGLTVTLFGLLTRADLLELKELMGRAALLVTALNRAWNERN